MWYRVMLIIYKGIGGKLRCTLYNVFWKSVDLQTLTCQSRVKGI